MRLVSRILASDSFRAMVALSWLSTYLHNRGFLGTCCGDVFWWMTGALQAGHSIGLL